MQKILLFLLLTFSNSIMAQSELQLKLNQHQTLKVNVLNPDEFKSMKTDLTLIDHDLLHHYISGIFQNKDGHTVLSLPNGSALEFKKEVAIEALSKVTFSRVSFLHKKDEITYSIGIDETFYEYLKSSIEQKITAPELDFFGTFHTLNNGNVLVKWNPNFSTASYALLKDARTITTIDIELADYIEEIKIDPKIDYSAILENTDYEKVNLILEADGMSNMEVIIDRLSEVLNIDKEHLDYSSTSIERIENALIWNSDKLNKYEVFDLCFPYVGEVARRTLNLVWVESNGYFDLVHEQQAHLGFAQNLQEALVQNDYMPQVKWVIEDLESKLK